MTRDISIERLVNFPVSSNCYIIKPADTDECILVDPAQEDGRPLDDYLIKNGLNPVYIILTHEHFDHISSVELLRNKYQARVIASASCSVRITDSKTNLSLFFDQKGFTCLPADILIGKDHASMEWEGIPIRFYETPGHSEGSICFSVGDNLFTGDTYMENIKSVTKLPGSSKVQLENSIKLLDRTFGRDILVFPGHGEIFRLTEWNVHQ